MLDIVNSTLIAVHSPSAYLRRLRKDRFLNFIFIYSLLHELNVQMDLCHKAFSTSLIGEAETNQTNNRIEPSAAGNRTREELKKYRHHRCP